MEENLISSLKLAEQSLNELKDNASVSEPSESSLLRLSSALKNIDKEVNKLRDVLNGNFKSSY